MSEKFPQKKYTHISTFFENYKKIISSSLDNIDLVSLKKAADLIEEKIKMKKNIFVCGNGGSAAISNHYVTDFVKMLRNSTKLKPKFFSLSSNNELISAISNDIQHSEIFTYQAETFCNQQDLLIIISSSGNSKNIIKLTKFAKKKKIKTIGFSGFDGGFLKKNSNICLHINQENYGLVEDCHHVLMHIICQFIRQRNIKNIKKIVF